MDPGIGDASDTALWSAAYRAREPERAGALFQDPLAGRLAGDRGRELARKMTGAEQFEWMTVVRTVVIDRYLQEAIARGVDTVVNLGAGLDTRPYRMTLPASLSWVEVDMPKIVALKEDRLAGETPRGRPARSPLEAARRRPTSNSSIISPRVRACARTTQSSRYAGENRTPRDRGKSTPAPLPKKGSAAEARVKVFSGPKTFSGDATNRCRPAPILVLPRRRRELRFTSHAGGETRGRRRPRSSGNAAPEETTPDAG